MIEKKFDITENSWVWSVAVDVVIFTLRDQDLQAYLIQRSDQPGFWSLPGGIVRETEALEEAAMRQLREQTTVEDVYLQQLYPRPFLHLGNFDFEIAISLHYLHFFQR